MNRKMAIMLNYYVQLLPETTNKNMNFIVLQSERPQQ